MPPLIKQSKLHHIPGIEPGKKFLIFTLGNEEYAIDILKVQEIRGTTTTLTVTKILEAPPHIRGIIYLHNTIAPIVDLRIFYHLKILDEDIIKVIILLNISQKLVGIIADTVSDIVELKNDQIKAAPDFFTIIHQDYVQGVGTIDNRLLIILDVEKLIYSNELQIAQHLEGNERAKE